MLLRVGAPIEQHIGIRRGCRRGCRHAEVKRCVALEAKNSCIAIRARRAGARCRVRPVLPAVDPGQIRLRRGSTVTLFEIAGEAG